MRELGKPFRDKKIKKKTENQSQNATCEQKSTSKKNLVQRKKSRPRMNFELIGKTIKKTVRSKKNKKTVKIKMKCRIWTKKSLAKANFCSNAVFSLYFKIRVKKFHATKPLAFSLHSIFGCDQNH